MSERSLWIRVNQEMVAKAIGELYFEEVLKAHLNDKAWTLKLQSGVTYEFRGWKTIWSHLRVNSSTIKRNGHPVESAAQFYIDTQAETGMTDITLGNFLQEMHNTLFSDLQIMKKRIPALQLSEKNGEEIQGYLNGHPKILLNKGRVGWGKDELEHYSPEAQRPFQLHWLAVSNDLVENKNFDYLDISFTSSEKEIFLNSVLEKIKDVSHYTIMPVHPWQWKNIIAVQFAGFVAREEIIYLGPGGDSYIPQISIRTLSNISRPECSDVKLPVSILNTSCVRGITASTIEIGKEVSDLLHRLVEDDSALKSVEILKETAGLAFVHPDYKQVKDAPYRFHEYFGVIVRESAASKLKANEKAIITASLFYQDENNNSLVGTLIEKSGLSASEWLKLYCKHVILPLYHLQLDYGVGMVAHGQNIVLKLTDYAPSGIFIKDFQGDLRISSEPPIKGKKLFGAVSEKLTKLPPNYLIHDLITGHFITVLRFISGAMAESENIPEKDFYRILSDEIQEYVKDRSVSDAQNILVPEFQKLLLNKVRFKIGYSDTTERPLPILGTQLKNPLFPGQNI